MTKNKGNWRSVSPEEAAVVTAIISASGLPGARTFIDDLEGAVAVASSKTDWILDIKTPNAGPGAELQNGPFPGRAFVPSNEDYRGEIRRAVGRRAAQQARLLTDNLPVVQDDLEEGAIVVLGEKTIRIRRLPI
jgi:hypothetical protein